MAAPVYVTGNVPSAAEVNSWFVNILFARKTANETINSQATFQDDDHLFVSVEANAIYHVIIELREASQTTDDFKLQFTGPAGFSFAGNARGPNTTAAALQDIYATEYVSGTLAFGGIGGNNLAVSIQGLLITSGTAGTFRLQWAQNTSGASGTTVLANSFMLLRRVS
jgi:hypothetical protein